MPDWKSEIRARLRGLHLTPTREAEIVEELSQHLDDRYESLLSKRSSADEARQAVVLELASLANELRKVETTTPKHPVVTGSPLKGGRRNVMRD
ncbi:MAG TPA: permease prefix domain 1-containing protein, partial [Pyrinomonadaceae bacterium]|nr:permease prefix domain 1-containing protein [Pyrinomonadaceae bacterium]